MKTFREFIAETKRMRVLNTAHYTSKEKKDQYLKKGIPDNSYERTYNPPGSKVVYATPSAKVGKEYGSHRVNFRIVNPKVVKTDSPRGYGHRLKNWMKTATDQELANDTNRPARPENQSKEAISKGAKVVKIPDAHKNPGAPDIRGNYHVIDRKLANKSISKNPPPTIRAKGKPRRTKTQPKRK